MLMLMCKTLSELVGADEPLFSIAIEQLERASGHGSVDVRLTAEIIGKAHQKTRELGLDPHDTSSEELYQALKELVKKHDEFIARRLGANDPTDVADVLPRLKALIEQVDIPRHAWVIKHSVIKRLLLKTPPKKLMKQLRYRTVDSMLKREPVAAILTGARYVESEAWQEDLLQKYRKLTPGDFEVRDIEVLLLDHGKWAHVAKAFAEQKRQHVTYLKELGAVILLPLPVDHMRGISITTLPLLLHYINEIRLYSAYFKLQQVSPKFGALLVETLQNDPGGHILLGNQPVHWRVAHRHFSTVSANQHPEVFEPHLQPEDLLWHKAEDLLYRLEPALHFWYDMDYVGTLRHGDLVSFNLLDMAINYVNDLPFGKHSVRHFQDNLWNELYVRYMGQPALEAQTVRQLGSTIVNTEPSIFDLVELF